jgi:hypothetical protein
MFDCVTRLSSVYRMTKRSCHGASIYSHWLVEPHPGIAPAGHIACVKNPRAAGS